MVAKVFRNTLSVEARRQTTASSGFRKTDASAKAVFDKLVKSPIPARLDHTGNRMIGAPPQHLMERIVTNTTDNVSDAMSLMQVLPELKIVQELLVSSILSPNDMVSTELGMSTLDNDLPSAMVSDMMTVMEEFLDKTYKIDHLLPEILRDCLFTRGCYPLLVLPESSLDNAINSPAHVAMEAIAHSYDADSHGLKGRGILGGREKTSVSLENMSFAQRMSHDMGLEAFNIDIKRTPNGAIVEYEGKPILSVTDNPDALKIPIVKNKLIADRATALSKGTVYNPGNMGNSQKAQTDQELADRLYKERQYQFTPILPIKTLSELDKITVGHPLIMLLPAESVIPVHTPGSPKNHVGYFVMLDRTGHPIDRSEYQNYYNDLSTNISQNRQMVSNIIAQTRRAEMGTAPNTQLEIEDMIQSYTTMVENDLLQRLKNGVYGESVAMTRNTEIYRIMFARACARMQTVLLYVPKSLLTYIAFDYNHYGVGKSLVEDTKILASIRSVLLFAQTMAEVKNSVSHTDLQITLDADEADPAAAVEQLIHNHVRNRMSAFPLAASSPLDITDFLNFAGIQVSVSGHEGYPNTSVKPENFQTGRIEPNTTLDDNLRKRHLFSFGISPEMVDGSSGVDFAATVTHNNLLMAKRTTQQQKILTAFIKDHVVKITENSGILRQKLIRVVETKKSTLEPEFRNLDPWRVVEIFLACLEFTLPSPDTVKLTTQMEAYKAYTDGFDEAVKAYLDTAFLPDSVMGDLAGVIEPTIAAIKAHYCRKWLRNNNVLPEMNDLVTWTDKDGPAIDILKETDLHANALMKTLGPYMDKIIKRREESDKRLQAEGGVPGAGGGGGDDLSGGGSDDLDGGLGGGDEFGDEGGDDFGDGGDGGLDMSVDTGEDDTATTDDTDTDVVPEPAPETKPVLQSDVAKPAPAEPTEPEETDAERKAREDEEKKNKGA